MRARLLLGLLPLGILTLACGPSGDLKAARLTDVSTGWFDAGVIEGGKNKLVPTITFRVKNEGSAPLYRPQFNIIFKQVGQNEEWSTVLVRARESEVPPAATSQPIVVRGEQGYTGTQPRAQMLQNSQFVDVRAEIYGKLGGGNWTKLGEFPLERLLLTR
jgi:hypothetical protein